MKVISVDNVKYIKNTNNKKFANILKQTGLQNKTFQLGDMIVLPSNVSQDFYVVQPCENINLIASKFNTSVENLERLNKCKNFFAGQKIKVR